MNKKTQANVNVGVLDTDFIDIPGLNADRYQLIYGAIRYCNEEESLYDLLVTLCKKYPEPVLLKAKLISWEAFLEERKTHLAELAAKSDKNDIKIIFPTYEKMRLEKIPTVFKTIAAINFLLEMIKYISPDGAGALCFHSKNSDYVLVPDMSHLMQECFDELIQKDIPAGGITQIVNWENKRRGLCYDSSLITDNQYESPSLFRDLLMDRYPIEPEESILNDDGSVPDILFDDAIKKGRTVAEITGVLYYALSPKGISLDTINKLAQYVCYPEQQGLKRDAESSPYRYIHSANNDTGAFSRNMSRIRYAMRRFGLELPLE